MAERSEKRMGSRRREVPQVRDEGDPAKALLRSQEEAFLALLLVIADVSASEKSFLIAYFSYKGGGTEEDQCRALASRLRISPEEIKKERDRLIGQLREKAVKAGFRREDF